MPTDLATPVIEELLAESGVRPPAKLKTALDAFHAANVAEFTPTDVHAVCASIAPADVPGLLEQLARERVFGPDAIRETRALADVQAALDARVRREFAAVVEPVTEGFRLKFDATASELVENVAKLPTTLELEHVSRHGTDALAAWGNAQEAAVVLDSLARRWDWLAGFVGRVVTTPVARAGRFCAFESRGSVNEILHAERTPPFGQWATLANLAGVELRWATLEQLDELAARFAGEDAQAAAQKEARRQEFRRQYGDQWLHIVESRERTSSF